MDNCCMNNQGLSFKIVDTKVLQYTFMIEYFDAMVMNVGILIQKIYLWTRTRTQTRTRTPKYSNTPTLLRRDELRNLKFYHYDPVRLF